MAAKKKRGLSGSPEHHASEAEALYKQARHSYDLASGHIKKGKCDVGFNMLRVGMKQDAAADAHRMEFGGSGGDSAAVAASKAEAAATHAFKGSCLSANLSGMKRRSRR